eukprot:5373312-Karenia_brevis.AAC.1
MLRLIVGISRRRDAAENNQSLTQHPLTQDHDNNNDDDVNSSGTTDSPHNPHDDQHEDMLEPWVDFIRRATHAAEKLAANLNIESWTCTYWRKKWAWAHRIALHGSDRWTQRII